VGVTGVSGTATAGRALKLLDSAVDAQPNAGVDTVAELQALADAAARVIAAAGGTAGDLAALTLQDLQTLGVTGLNAGNLATVLASIGATAPDSGIDTLPELQAIANTAINLLAGGAINAIKVAAQADNATPTTPDATVYQDAGVVGVDGTNLGAMNSALDTAAVNGAAVDSKAKVQTLVDAYRAILASADGTGANTGTALTGAQYTAVGVTGVSGSAAPGNALNLLNSAVDAQPTTGVDTVPELQAMADAAARVMAAAGGNPGQIFAAGWPPVCRHAARQPGAGPAGPRRQRPARSRQAHGPAAGGDCRAPQGAATGNF
jgi:copper homeostasis protein CutC